MTIIDTIPIYTQPVWLIILLCISSILAIILVLVRDTYRINDATTIIGLIAAILALICFVLLLTDALIQYDHDEYVIELDESASATEFFKNYEITKIFEYSNAWQVKKKR